MLNSHKKIVKKDSRRSGQAMLLATLTLGGAILGATSLAGLLMLYQIRATTDSVNSAKAIFVADSGVNWALYTYFHPPAGSLPASNGFFSLIDASVTVTCYDANANTIACDDSNATDAISEGTSNGARRAFLVIFGNEIATMP
jgi:hypothetical protein